MRPGFRPPVRAILLGTVLTAAAGSARAQCAAPGFAGPGTWRQYASPEEAGFSAGALEQARQRADSVQSAAVMAVYRGAVLVAWGDVERKLELHSVRKSLLSALMGQLAEAGGIDLDATLASLGVDDIQPLTTGERTARVRDLLAARSGVYLPAAYAPSDQDTERPARGAYAPDTHWFYNNWDFNVAEALYEQAAGASEYQAFAERIAGPLGMEDYAPSDGFLAYEPSASRFPAHTFRMSTRDLARFGQLYLQNGCWGGRQVLPAGWVEESTRPRSSLGEGQGYGYLWWTYGPGSLSPDQYPHLSQLALYVARGTGGQGIFVVPAADLVVVHRGDTDHGRSVRGPDVWAIVESILAARRGPPASNPRLRPMESRALASQLPVLVWPSVVDADPATMESYYGAYEIAAGAVVRVFSWEARTIITVPGEGEAELLRTGEDEFTIRVAPGVRVRFDRDGAGRVVGLTMTMGPRTLRARRLD